MEGRYDVGGWRGSGLSESQSVKSFLRGRRAFEFLRLGHPGYFKCFALPRGSCQATASLIGAPLRKPIKTGCLMRPDAAADVESGTSTFDILTDHSTTLATGTLDRNRNHTRIHTAVSRCINTLADMSRRAPNPAAERAAQNTQTIKGLLKLEGNKTCADCKRNKRESSSSTTCVTAT